MMPKIYHILHLDRLRSLIRSQSLLSDALVREKHLEGTTIGMDTIKDRRLHKCQLRSHPGLFVGQCVPFYFCPRPVMLYMIHKRNAGLTYQDGQEKIIHLVGDLQKTIAYANSQKLRWAFTTSNAASSWFSDYADLNYLDEVHWDIINSDTWAGNQEWKQAEFLIENCMPWALIDEIAVFDEQIYHQVNYILETENITHPPKVTIKREWYY